MSFKLLGLAAAAVPFLVAAFMPRRRLLVGLALAFLTPFVGLAVVIGYELINPSPGAYYSGDLPLVAFLFIGALFLLPWLVAFPIATGLGLLLRRVTRPVQVERAPASSRASSTPAAPASAVAPLRFAASSDAPSLVMRATATAPIAYSGSLSRSSSNPAGSKLSPDGSILVELDAKEWSNTHWVNSPRITDRATGAVILDLWETDWDANVSFPALRKVHLFLRRYRSGNALAVDLDLIARTYQIVMEPGHEGPRPAEPLDSLREGLEAASLRSETAPGAVRIPQIRPPPFASWRIALLLVFLGLAAAGAATLLSPGPQTPSTELTSMPSPPVIAERP